MWWRSVPGFAIVPLVQITVRLEEADLDALSELREWLLEADAVRRYGRLRWAEVATSGASAVGMEALQVVVGTGFSVRQLLVAIGQWQDSRGSGPRVLVSRPAPDGRPVCIASLDSGTLEEAISALESG
jgi:hypothetical protein